MRHHENKPRVATSIQYLGTRASSAVARIKSIARAHPKVFRLWIGILLLSALVASWSAFLSNLFTRQSTLNTLLVGVITLFTISLTITTMGIQLASERYSYRLDSSVLQLRPVALHFSPHLSAIILGVSLSSFGYPHPALFGLFVFSSVAAILSTFPFLLWLLGSLTPNNVLTTAIGQIDDEFLEEVEDIVSDARAEYFDNPQSSPNEVYREVTYSQTTENDPVDAVSDIIRSSIAEEDTGTAKRVLNKYVNQLEPTVIDRYREFKTSHSDSQLVCWYVYAPLEDIFRHALKHDNDIIANEVISLLRESIDTWYGENRDVPEVFLRMFGRVTIDYATECDPSQLNSVASEYSSIANVVAKDIQSPHTRINRAVRYDFGDNCLAFAIQSIERDRYRAARTITNGLRSIIEAQLRIPSSDPERNLLSLGLIGEKFASEDAKSKQIVEIANEVSIMDEAEWVVTTLVTFIDKIDEYGNDYASESKYRDLVEKEIERVNDALESRTQKIAADISKDDALISEVIRTSRFFRGPFTVEELYEEMDSSVDIGSVSDICALLARAGVMDSRGENEYVTNLRGV